MPWLTLYRRCMYGSAGEKDVVIVPRGTERSIKNDRFNIRWSAEERELIDRAADASEKTLTAFVRDASFAAAQKVLADRTVFRLTAEQWRAFTKALDRPAIERPRLRRLMSRPTI